MTNKTEDRFYFGKHGQPERFDMEDACWEGYEPVGTKQKDGKTVPNCVPMKNAAGDEDEMASGPFTKEQDARLAAREEKLRKQRAKKALEDYKTAVREEERYAGSVFVTPRRMAELEARTQSAYEEAKRLNPDYKGFSRPGQPDTFDASSLERGAFAEASKSPMLGKLLAAKAMPDGGWRAVQVGSDTLVISFEDADLARDFGRRVSSKGYSATSPVATTGRYWNVEVKNG